MSKPLLYGLARRTSHTAAASPPPGMRVCTDLSADGHASRPSDSPVQKAPGALSSRCGGPGWVETTCRTARAIIATGWTKT